MSRRLLLVVVCLTLLLVGAGAAAVAVGPHPLRAEGPATVHGTPASGVFEIGDRTIRQIRYVDRGTLVYSFRLSNEGVLPVTVEGLVVPEREPRLFEYLRLLGPRGQEWFSVAAGETVDVDLELRMTGCETLSARAGSFVTDVPLRVSGPLGLGTEETTLRLPEEIRAGSPREAGCANATATSRPPG